ncbi:unnamed protein product [Rotaria sordida]|uniref:F-box domain-containing protein n=1 Tax=Rotaria sordida TaxID=392033 RepID=A0A814Y8M7_9BILA|nr:unnamed protein product [Rotaria sordida]
MTEKIDDCASFPLSCLPNEIVLHIFSYFSFETIVNARAVCRLWHFLIPQAINPLYQTLLSKYLSNSIPTDLPEYLQVTVDQRQSFVDHVESTYNIRLSKEFRRTLLEWPSRYPPPGSQWPETLCWYANKVCLRCLKGDEQCQCYHPELVHDSDITLTRSVFSLVMNNLPIRISDDDDSFAWELFDNPPRLTGKKSEEQTRRMIRLYSETLKQRTDSSLWVSLYIKCLPLHTYGTKDDVDQGSFCLILNGEAKGEIHGWRSGWYDGWEANSFLEFSPKPITN